MASMARESGLFFCVEISLAWVPFSDRGTPFPWREIPFPIEPSSVTIISSLTVHNGGGRPVASKGDKYIAFFSIKQEWFAQSIPAATKSPQNYDDNMAVCMPPWIEQAKQNELCAYLSCRRFVEQEKSDQDFFQATIPLPAQCVICSRGLCKKHQGEVCGSCPDLTQKPAPISIRHVFFKTCQAKSNQCHFPGCILCYMPTSNTTFYAVQRNGSKDLPFV